MTIKTFLLPLALASLMPLAATAQTAPAAPATPAPAAPAAPATPAPAAPTAAPVATAPATVPVPASMLTVSDAYVLSNNPRVGAAFMTIANAGPADCVLTGATSQAIAQPELHTHAEENGVMRMVRVDSMTVPAGGTHALQRGGDHIMLLAPRTPLAAGQDVDLLLDFGSCGTVPVTARVDNQAGRGGMGMGRGRGGGRGMGGGMGGGMHHGHGNN